MSVKRWVGWVWEDGAWLSVCDDADMGECHRQLIRYADERGIPMRYTSITGGHRPEWTLEGL